MTATAMKLPSFRGETGLAAYLREISRFPILGADEEYMLARAWRDHQDIGAAHRLVTSHLRLVAKVAVGYRGYGLPLSDLVAEGNIGMMQAVKRFDPERGFRLATYALWWIRAAIQEYVLRSWSLVKIGTTAAQKKLFFNLRRLKRDIKAVETGDLPPEQVRTIAERLAVDETEVVDMNRRLGGGGDQSLNVVIGEEGGAEWQDRLADEAADQETALGEKQEAAQRQVWLERALKGLNARERAILTARRLREEPPTLEDLSREHGISRERVRQIEARALAKLQTALRKEAPALLTTAAA